MSILTFLLTNTSNPFPIAGILWAMIYFYMKTKEKYSAPDMSKAVNDNRVEISSQIVYYSNGRYVQDSLDRHYRQTLGISENELLTYDLILDAASRKIEIYAKGTPSSFRIKSIINYKTAAKFLIDQLDYLGHLN